MPRTLLIVFSVLVAVLVITNVTQFFFYQRSVAEKRELVNLLTNMSTEMDNLRSLIAKQDGSSADKLGAMKEQINTRLTALAPPPKAKQKKEPARPTLKAREVDALMSVSSLVAGIASEYVLLVEKETNLLHLFRFEKNGTRLIKTYPCVVGENKKDKQREGDMATPVGVYFLTYHLPDKDLAELYGAGAFVLNYPSLFDYKIGKKGNGIWLHGHPRDQKLGEDKTSTKGCIVVSNEDLLELAGKIRVMKTPIVVTDKMFVVSEEHNSKTQKEIMDFVEKWRLAWESKDTKRFISIYSPDYINNMGMNLKEFKAQKEKIATGKRYIKVGINDVFILTTGRNGDIFVVKFRQHYRSDSYSSPSNKLLYIQKKTGSWLVVGESVY